MKRRTKRPQPQGLKKETPFFKPNVQTKLKMGSAGDKYEVEADKMADQVVNKYTTDTAVQTKGNEEEIQQKPLGSEITPFVQKKEASGEEPVQMMEEEKIQAKTESPKSLANSQLSFESKLRNGNKGKKIDAGVRREMELGFGADFSNVNIHSDNEAVKMSQGLGAQAFTHGDDIYFNKGKYNPNSKEGKHLLAHELTHTIQQKGMVQKKIQKKKDSKYRIPDEVRRISRLNRLINREMIIPNLDGTIPTFEEARARVISRVKDKKWFRGSATKNHDKGVRAAHKSETTGWYYTTNIRETNTLPLSELRLTPRGGVMMPADNAWRTRDLDPLGRITSMLGTITFIVRDRSQPDYFSLLLQTSGGPLELTIPTDPDRNPLDEDTVTITVPLEILTSNIINFKAKPSLPDVPAESSTYDLTILVNGEATLGNSQLQFTIDGESSDPSKVPLMKKKYYNKSNKPQVTHKKKK